MPDCTAKATSKHRSAREAAKCPVHGHRAATRADATMSVRPEAQSLQPEVHRTYSRNGYVLSEEWLLNGVLHREDGPATVAFDSAGNVVGEEWWLAGVRHRQDGPATVIFGSDGSRVLESWYLNGVFHREDGPAGTRYDKKGKTTCDWVLNNLGVSPHLVLAPSWGVSRDNVAAIELLSDYDFNELSADHPAVLLVLATHRNP